jgi:hypothetical protein
MIREWPVALVNSPARLAPDRRITMEGASMNTSMPRVLLRAEGIVLLASATLLFAREDASWWLFALLFFAPDLAMVGYAAGTRIGAYAYNALHSTAVALPLALAGLVADWPAVLAIGLVWLAHIGFDRVLGYGLKYPEGFKETHLQRV